ncbi:MAG: transcriptional regulator, LuxR family [Frankiales bacterium]|nr:transcriptional regulator, LuxR family [Frankiales bacterium]
MGRAEELARLLEHVDRGVAGHPSAVLLAGDAGVGKTRLLAELAVRAADRGVRVLTGHCVDLGDVGLPYLPFVDLLRPVAADPRLASAAAGLPALTDLLTVGRGAAPMVPSGSGAAGVAPAPAQRNLRPALDDGRLQLFESVAALLGELSAAAPLLLVLEDVHWADRSSRDLLRYLLARLTDERLTIVASYRSDDLHRRHPMRPLLAELVRLPGVERMELGPLSDAHVAELVRRLADSGGGVAESEVAGVVARAEGNAFYAEELVAAGLQCESLPWVLADVLLARVERLPPDPQQVLRVAAVAGRRVRHELMAAVSGLAAVQLEQALAEAVHHHLLVVDDDGRYRFRHALLREAVLHDLLPGERVRLHAAVAAYLTEHRSAGTAAERAHHARESNDLPGALSASVEAAEEAHRSGAPAEQLQHLEAALALWPAVPDAVARAGHDQGQLLVEAALAARAGGDLHRSVALLRSARDVLSGGADVALRARVHYTLAQALIWLDDFQGAHAESSAAMALVPADPPSPERAWAAATHVRSSLYVGRRREADAAAQEALAIADVLGLDSAWADTAVSLARAFDDDDPALARGRLDEALARARRSGDVDVEMRVLFNLAIVAHEAGRLGEALEWTASAVERAHALGVESSFYPAELRHLRIVTAYMAGEWDTSLAVADQLFRLPETAAHVKAAGLLVLVGRGDPAARERIDWARGLSARPGDQGVMLLVNTSAAEVDLAAWEGDAGTAVRRADEGVRRLAELWPVDRLAALRIVATGVSAAADAAAAARLVGNEALAARWVAAGEALAGQAEEAAASSVASGGVLGLEARAWQQRIAAELAWLRGRAGPEEWQAAVDGFAALGHVYEEARTRWRLAEGLIAADRREEAGAELRAAHEVAVRLGAEPLRAAVEALARRARLDAGLPGAGRVVDPSEVFTPREVEVLALMAQGRTNRQIGAALYISEKTASVHVSNILGKLSAGSRTEAVAVAAARGLLPQAGRATRA